MPIVWWLVQRVAIGLGVVLSIYIAYLVGKREGGLEIQAAWDKVTAQEQARIEERNRILEQYTNIILEKLQVHQTNLVQAVKEVDRVIQRIEEEPAPPPTLGCPAPPKPSIPADLMRALDRIR